MVADSYCTRNDIRELALMINGEGWLPGSRKCDLAVIKCKNYTHQTKYQLPIPHL